MYTVTLLMGTNDLSGGEPTIFLGWAILMGWSEKGC